MDNRDRTFLSDLKKDLSEYLDLRLEVLKLTVYEKTARVSSSAASVIILVFLLFFFLLFLFMTLGFYFAQLLGSNTAGFGIVTLFYLVLFIVFLAVRKPLFEKKLVNKIIEELTEDEEA